MPWPQDSPAIAAIRAEIAREDEIIFEAEAAFKAAFKAAKARRSALMKEFLRISAAEAADRDRPLFARVETPPGQPAGLVAGDQPGAAMGALSNTLRPARPDDAAGPAEARPEDRRRPNAARGPEAGGEPPAVEDDRGAVDPAGDRGARVPAGPDQGEDVGQGDPKRKRKGKARDDDRRDAPKLATPDPQAAVVAEAAPVDEPAPVIETDLEKVLEAESVADAEAGDYDPTHPWYYKLGGKPLTVEEIEPAEISDTSASVHIGRLPKDAKARAEKLRTVLERNRDTLARDSGRYRDLVERGAEALDEYERALMEEAGDDEDSSNELQDALALRHNHIAYGKGMVAALERLLAATPEPGPKKPARPKKSAAERAREIPTGQAIGAMDPEVTEALAASYAEELGDQAERSRAVREDLRLSKSAAPPEGVTLNEKGQVEKIEVRSADPSDPRPIVFDSTGTWKKCPRCHGDQAHEHPMSSVGLCHRTRLEVTALGEAPGDWRSAASWEMDLGQDAARYLDEIRIKTVGGLHDEILKRGSTPDHPERDRCIEALGDYKAQLRRNHEIAEARRAGEAAPKKPRTKPRAKDVAAPPSPR